MERLMLRICTKKMKMGLFRPEWMDPNESVADSAVKKLTKEAELIRAALQSPHKRVRQYA